MVPVVALAGTEVVMEVAVPAVTMAAMPLNFTILFAGTGSKPVPVSATEVPMLPLVGLKPVMTGREGVVSVIVDELVEEPEAFAALT